MTALQQAGKISTGSKNNSPIDLAYNGRRLSNQVPRLIVSSLHRYNSLTPNAHQRWPTGINGSRRTIEKSRRKKMCHSITWFLLCRSRSHKTPSTKSDAIDTPEIHTDQNCPIILLSNIINETCRDSIIQQSHPINIFGSRNVGHGTNHYPANSFNQPSRDSVAIRDIGETPLLPPPPPLNKGQQQKPFYTFE